MIVYKTSDGTEFSDPKEADRYEFELHLRKLEAIGKHTVNDTYFSWYVLLIFVAGYLFGWFCN